MLAYSSLDLLQNSELDFFSFMLLAMNSLNMFYTILVPVAINYSHILSDFVSSKLFIMFSHTGIMNSLMVFVASANILMPWEEEKAKTEVLLML